MSQEIQPDPDAFMRLSRAVMPYGKYAGRRLVELPEPYVVWLRQNGFPKGSLGDMLEAVYAIKLNGLEYLFRKRRKGGDHGFE